MVAQAITVLPVGDAPTEAVVEPKGFATCPSCHTVDTALTNASLAAGANWRCGRCGQMWDQKRIATVTAYAAWDAARQRRQNQRRAGVPVAVGEVGKDDGNA